MSQSAKPWYAEGLKFSCQQCARCCVNHGDYTNVYVTPKDERQLAELLGLSLAAFRREHTSVSEGFRALKIDPGDEACRFLDGKSCGVYEARPTQCRTWPFWSSTLDEQVWNEEVLGFCLGAGQGRLHSREEIEASAAESDDDHRP